MKKKRLITNVDPGGPTQSGKNRKPKLTKSVWYVDSVRLSEDPEGGPSRYGPEREYIANFQSEEMASEFVRLWNIEVIGPSRYDLVGEFTDLHSFFVEANFHECDDVPGGCPTDQTLYNVMLNDNDPRYTKLYKDPRS